MNVITENPFVRFHQYLHFILSGLLVAGCASVSINSTKDPTFVERLRHIYILVNPGQLTQEYNDPLINALDNAFAQEDIKYTIKLMDPLVLDEDAYLDEIKSYSPQAVLTINPTGGVVGEYGGYVQVIYDVSLYRPTLKKRLWRARIENSGGVYEFIIEKRMRMMADSILKKLKEDQLL